MSLPILAVDKDIEISNKEQAVWQKHGIPTVRVDTMQEALEHLAQNDFLFVAINSDSISYLSLLKVMSSMFPVHIFIIDSCFTHERQNEAFNNGATWYGQFQESPEKNIQSALSYLKSVNRRIKVSKKAPNIITYGNLSILADYRKVFCNDAEVILTHK